MRTFAIAILYAAGTLPLACQSIEGRVINSATNDPVANATVSMECVRPVTQFMNHCRKAETQTSEDGTFQFSSVYPFVYMITAGDAPGLVSTRASRMELEVNYKHRTPAPLLKLEPESSLSGRVTDMENQPKADVEVVAWREFATGPSAYLKAVAEAISNKAGTFSFPHLVPGNYYVGTALVTTKQVSKLRDRPVEQYELYAPSALSLEEAVSTHLDMGQTAGGVELKLRPILTHLIQGRAQMESMGQNTYDKLELHLDPRDQNGVAAPGRELKLDDDGKFQANLTPGSYILRLVGTTAIVNPKTPKAPPDTFFHLLAKQDLEVGGKDILNITLLIPPPFVINGQITLESAPENKLDLGSVTFKPVDAEAASGSRTASVQADGTFGITNCDAASYTIQYKPPAGTYVRAITFNEQDAMTHVIDLSAVSGGDVKIMVRPGASSVATATTDSTARTDFVLIPDNWTPYGLVPVIHMTSQGGRDAAVGIAPGRYSAVAVPAVQHDLWENAVFVHELAARGTPFELAENSQKQVDPARISEDDLRQIQLQLGLYY